MRHIILFAASMIVCSLAFGQVSTLADVKTKSAVQLSADDLKQLLPGSKVTANGGSLHWENSPNGSAEGAHTPAGRSRPLPASGNWKIDDQGAYCVDLNWSAGSAHWCRYLFKMGDKYYAFDTLEDTAQANEFEFSK